MCSITPVVKALMRFEYSNLLHRPDDSRAMRKTNWGRLFSQVSFQMVFLGAVYCNKTRQDRMVFRCFIWNTTVRSQVIFTRMYACQCTQKILASFKSFSCALATIYCFVASNVRLSYTALCLFWHPTS